MSKKYMVLWICTLNLAFGVNLEEILSYAKEHSALEKSIEAKKISLELATKSSIADDGLMLNGSTTQANPLYTKAGMEYEVGISKKFVFNETKALTQNISTLEHEAVFMEDEIKSLEFENRLKSLYHRSCIERKNFVAFKNEVDNFKKLYAKKQKAYKLGEISKLELWQLEMEMSEMLRNLAQKEATSKTAHDIVLNLASLKEQSALSCNDLYPLKSIVPLGDGVFALSNEATKKRIESTQNSIELYSKAIDSMDISTYYTKELEQRKYGVGISIPLNFTSSKNEFKKAEMMAFSSQLSLEHEHKIKALMSELEQYYYDLKIAYLELQKLDENKLYYKQKLLPLIVKSYEYGHTTPTEYLLAKAKLYQLENASYEAQKKYYDSLFNLYSVAQVRSKR